MRRPLAPLAAARRRLELEGGHPDDVGVLEEEAREHRDLVEVAGVDGRVEDDRDRQAARPLDVLAPHGVQRFFARVFLEALRRVDVERDVEEAGAGELREKVARGADAVGEEGRAQAALGDAADDRDELLPRRSVGSPPVTWTPMPGP